MNCPHCNAPIEVELRKSGGSPSNSAGQTAFSDVGLLLERIDDGALTKEFEREFVADMRSKFSKYGERMYISDKQIAVLRRIANGDRKRHSEEAPF